MVVAKAIKGLKNLIRHREQMVKGLDDLSRDWKSDFAKHTVEGLEEFLNNEIGVLEWILSQLQSKNGRKRQ